MDAWPVLSQGKSLWQLVSGDSEGARKTQDNFSKQCIGVSQVRSAVEALSGDEEAARNTQKEFGRAAYATAKGVPGVGHAIGVGHYIAGDREGGDGAMMAATRTTGTIVGGAFGGPVGAIAAATAMDGVNTLYDSAVHDEFKPNGTFGLINSYKDPGSQYDKVCDIVLAGYAGKSARSTARSIASRHRGMRITPKVIAKTIVKEAKPRPSKLRKFRQPKPSSSDDKSN